MNKHTPGPWYIVLDFEGRPYIINADRARVCGDFTENDPEANANLIAAAPLLLERLWAATQLLVALRDGHLPPSAIISEEMELNWTAIAKAEGM